MLHLYAIAESEAAVRDAPAIGGRPLRTVVAGRLAAVCSEHEGAPPQATTDAVRRHAAVVEALAEDGAVLPARFGTAFADDEGVRRALAERADELVAALGRVRGRVELGVRVVDGRPAPPAAAADGRSYLLARLDAQRRSAALADELHGALVPLAAAATLDVAPAPRLLLSAAYLVERDRVEPFRSRVEALAAERPELDLVCTGPWPPYSFAGAGEGSR